MKAYIWYVVVSIPILVTPFSASADDIARADREIQAEELLGGNFTNPDVEVGIDFADASSFVKQWVSDHLKGARPHQAKRVARELLRSSELNGLDPIFILAVIQSESSFRVKAKGKCGEIGLMQLRPQTARWLARRHHLPWHGKRTLLDPVQNIRLGAAYFALLREKFDYHGRLYLAAFNMGPSNTRRAVSHHHWPKDYPLRVMKQYLSFYASLREAVAEQQEDESREGAE